MSGTVEGRQVRIGSAAFFAERGVAVPNIENAHATALYIASERDLMGMLVVADSLRPKAVEAVKDLRAMGLWLEWLTGDTQQAADELGKQAPSIGFRGRCYPTTSYVVWTHSLPLP